MSLVDELVEDRFFPTGKGLATPDVRILDPAMGTGTFLLSVLRTVAERAAVDGPGKVPAALEEAAQRIHGFELQVGPYTVAEMRLAAELVDQAGGLPRDGLRVYVTNTLEDHRKEPGHFGHVYAPLTDSQRAANEIKGPTPLVVVLGNPPYKHYSRGKGAWVEQGDENEPALLRDWLDAGDASVEPHLRHVYNLYVYFWRWAAWKVFERDQSEGDANDRGVVAFVSVAGFLANPGFKPMRQWLRRKCDDIYVINLTPEGHQPPVSSRPFREVQQPVCVCIAVRTGEVDEGTPANVWYHAVSPGQVADKYRELVGVRICGGSWKPGGANWQDPFLPVPSQEWEAFPRLEEFVPWSGTGVMAGRTWVYAPDTQSLYDRWKALVAEADFDRKQRLFKPHTKKINVGDREIEKVADRHIAKELSDDLPGYSATGRAIVDEPADGMPRTPIRIAFRSFDRQYLIPDKRLINRDNPPLWRVRSAPGQVFLTAVLDQPFKGSGPAATFTSLMPDAHHFDNRGGRVFPLWLDADASRPNVNNQLLQILTEQYGHEVEPEDVFAYLAAVLANPYYAARFAEDLNNPGLRIPVTAHPDLFDKAVDLGSRVIWLHTFGSRYTNDDRPAGAPRAQSGIRPELKTPIAPLGGRLPDRFDYDPDSKRLTIGGGEISPVREEVVDYTVGRMNVLRRWLDYRWAHQDTRATRDPKRASPLDKVTHDRWQPIFDDDLLDMLNVLTLLVDLEPDQADLLEAICEGPLMTRDQLHDFGALADEEARRAYRPKVPRASSRDQPQLPGT